MQTNDEGKNCNIQLVLFSYKLNRAQFFAVLFCPGKISQTSRRCPSIGFDRDLTVHFWYGFNVCAFCGLWVQPNIPEAMRSLFSNCFCFGRFASFYSRTLLSNWSPFRFGLDAQMSNQMYGVYFFCLFIEILWIILKHTDTRLWNLHFAGYLFPLNRPRIMWK